MPSGVPASRGVIRQVVLFRRTMNEIQTKKDYLPTTAEDLIKFVLIGREKLVSVRAQIRAINKIGLATEVREQKKNEAQDLAGALLDAEVKIGELLPAIIEQGKSKVTPRGLLPKVFSKNQSKAFQDMSQHPEIVEQVKAQAKENDDLPTRTEVLRIIKEQEKNERISKESKARGKIVSLLDLRTGDFKKVLADIKDIDAIITDPPYPAEFINCFSELGKYAKEHLREGGFCVVYSGQYHLPEVIKRLSEHLTYVWTFCLYHIGQGQLVNGVNIMCGWKPILIFSRGAKKMRFSAYDVVDSNKREKFSHEWQQGEGGAGKLIDIFTHPGELVVDPFSGSGTFGKVANEMGRRFVGAEIKELHF